MGERKGQNFYYPPDFDYKKHKNLNAYHGTHALRERAAKIKQGILIIRFEMPFNIWCLGCNNHVGMGVRYNAEKKKVGMYYTTPIYEFRMKCHLCDNYFVIRTDPEHFDYELVEGCRRQEKRYDPSTIDQLGAVDRAFNLKLEGDKMFKVEHLEKDKLKEVSASGQTEKLEWVQERMRDDFAANQALRHSFRLERKELSDQRVKDDDLRRRMSLSIQLLPETEESKRESSLIFRHRLLTRREVDDGQCPTSSSSIMGLKRGLPGIKNSTPLSKKGRQLVGSLASAKNKGFSNFTSSSVLSASRAPSIGALVKRNSASLKDVKSPMDEASSTPVPSTDSREAIKIEGDEKVISKDNCNISLPESDSISAKRRLVADYSSSSSDAEGL